MDQRPRDRSARQARNGMPAAAPQTWRDFSGYRMRMGGADLPCGAASRRSRAWRDAVRGAIPVRTGQDRGAGLGDRVSVELRDYTGVEGQFDKISVLEMSEHVGYENHPSYYGTIHRLLKADGLFLHHAITRLAKRDEKTFRKKSAERS